MSYLGSKGANGAWQAIVSRMPPHDTYIETHLGSGVVLQRKPAVSWSIGVDRDPAAIDAFRAGAPELADELVTGDAVAFLEGFDFASAGRVLVYADPPYVLATRRSTKRYRCDYTDADHLRLIACLRALPVGVAVMLSGYPSALYDALLPDWRRFAFQVGTRGGPATEVLWMNYASVAVHWATAAGDGWIDRQRIKRKAARWAAMYRALSAGERLAVLAAMLDAVD